MSNEEVPFSKLKSSDTLLSTRQPTDLDDHVSENRQLKMKILELSSELQRNMIYFNRLLGATEYELEQRKKTNEDLLDKQNLKIQSLQHENETYRNEISALKIDLKKHQEAIQLKQDKIDQMEDLNESKTEKSDDTKASKVIPIFVEDLKCELERYQIAFEKTKKLLETETCRAEAAESHQKLEQHKFNEYRTRIEAEIIGIKASLSVRHNKIRQLNKRISDLTLEKQNLHENLFKSYQLLKHFITILKSLNDQLIQQLYKYIKENINEIQCILKQLMNLLNGIQLNLNELLIQPKPLLNINEQYNELNISSSSIIDNDNNSKDTWEDSFDDIITIASQLTNNINPEQLYNSLDQLIKTRSVLIKLRQQLANKYADHLGEKIDCIVQ
ncbi:hypothetical protein Smp_178210 [Schistosoma mansoni]|uniref:hypothetical protein n=1 Tax=Schistosoma mansoni TaxID=6183 RepID=UPI0001A61FF4|nr:hypothetical protein Smp_178210 [Schistosoma mansoni]|eukprot:XP_018644442.1 hypothetical protein Smp_178210 [Schistosoma mansoni]